MASILLGLAEALISKWPSAVPQGTGDLEARGRKAERTEQTELEDGYKKRSVCLFFLLKCIKSILFSSREVRVCWKFISRCFNKKLS